MRWNVLTSNSLYAVSVESMGNSGAGHWGCQPGTRWTVAGIGDCFDVNTIL